VGTETEGEYGRGQAVAADNPVDAASVVLPKQPSSEGFSVDHEREQKGLLGELSFCVWLVACMPS